MPVLSSSILPRIWSKLLAPARGIQVDNFRGIRTCGALQTLEKIEVFDAPVSYQKVGNGGHTLLFMPRTMGLFQMDFAKVLKNLDGKKYTGVFWDPPGQGFSRPPDRDFSSGLKEYLMKDAHVARELMAKLGFDKFTALGWATGGLSALLMAAYYPSAVAKAVVWGAKPFLNENDTKQFEQFRDIKDWPLLSREPLVAAYGEEYLKKCWEDFSDMSIRHQKDSMLLSTDGDILSDELTQVGCPTLILHGAKDDKIQAIHTDELYANIKRSKVEVIEEGAHDLHENAYEEFEKVVHQFLDEDSENIWFEHENF